MCVFYSCFALVIWAEAHEVGNTNPKKHLTFLNASLLDGEIITCICQKFIFVDLNGGQNNESLLCSSALTSSPSKRSFEFFLQEPVSCEGGWFESLAVVELRFFCRVGWLRKVYCFDKIVKGPLWFSEHAKCKVDAAPAWFACSFPGGVVRVSLALFSINITFIIFIISSLIFFSFLELSLRSFLENTTKKFHLKTENKSQNEVCCCRLFMDIYNAAPDRREEFTSQESKLFHDLVSITIWIF